MDMNCPACRPPDAEEEICDNCKRILSHGFCVIIFFIMEIGFGAAITFSAVKENYLALGVFAFAAILSVKMVI